MAMLSCTTEHACRAHKRAWLCAWNGLDFTSNNMRVVHKDVHGYVKLHNGARMSCAKNVHGYVLAMAQASTNKVRVVRN